MGTGTPARLPRSRPGGRLRGDRGSTTVEMTLWSLGFLLCLTCAVQGAVWCLAELAAHHAANQAVQTTRVHGGTATAGHDQAVTVLIAIDGHLLTDPTVTVTR